MKHNSLISANGFHTPIASTTVKSSVLTTIFKPLLLLLLLMIVGTNAAWADNITFQGTEIFYFDKSSNSGWGTVVANDADVYLEFANSGNNATKSSAAQWEVENSILKVTVPSGTYNQVRIVRGQKGNPSSIWNTFSWINLQSGKNQILYGGSWDTYGGGGGDPEPFDGCAFTANSTMYFDLRNAPWYNDGACFFAEFYTENTSRGESSQLSETGTSHVYSFQIPNRNDITKVVINRYNNSVKQSKWGYTADMTAETAGTNDCIYMPAWTGDPVSCNWTTFGSGSITTNCGPAALNCRLMGDFWLKADNGWLGTDKGPQFIDNGDGTATISYLVNTQAPRFTFVKEGIETSENKWDDTHSTSGFKNDFGSKKYKFNKIASGVKKVTLTYTEATDKLAGVYGAYDVDYTGWKLYVDGGSALDMDNSGQRVVSLASGDHTFYITDGSATTFYGINKFGGMYLSTSYTNQGVTITFPSQRYYDTGGTYKFNINGDNIPTYPINGQYDLSAKFSINKAANVTFSFDGGVISLAAVEPVAPHTVTIHPNNGESTFTMNVADGGTISSISASYGNGTASWYKDAEFTQAFTLNSSTVDDDMDLYAKWGVSGNFYIGGDMWMHEKNGNNWAYYSTMAMTTTDGVASVTYIAPKGRNRFEILTTRSNWSTIANQGSGLIAASTPTLSWAQYGPDNNNHFVFNLDAPKKVTIRYNGKVSVTAEDYDVVKTGWTVVSPTLFGHGSDDNADYADNNTFMSGYNMTEGQMDSNGERTFLNVAPGTYKFWIGKYNTNLDKTKQQIEVFGAANVDKANSSLTGYGSLADVNNPHINRNIPQDDKLHRRVQFTLTQTASIKIAFDGGKITVNLLPKYTVSYDSKGGSDVASQSVFEGTTATEPSAPTKDGYTFVKWQLNGSDYNFSNPVTEDITLDAVWAYKAIESVSLNESTHMTWVGNSDFTLTPTLAPSDLITKSVAWNSNNTSVATVSNGTVHAVSAGSATITCTVTDQFDHQETATCEVTVAACEMATDNIYSMTVTGYNSSTGDNATLSGLWNESSDNDGPANMTVCNVRIGNNGGSNEYYAYDNNGNVMIEQRSDNDVDKWYMIDAGTNLYYLKNVYTGKYMYCGPTNTTSSKGNGWSNNGDWFLRSVYTSASNGETDSYKFYRAKDDWNNDVIVSRADASMGAKATATDFVLSRQQLTGTPGVWNDVVTNTVSASRGAEQGGNTYKGFQSAFVNEESVPNPNYKASLMNGSYYRMNTDATVQANLAAPLVSGAVITVRLYADANTTVKLQKTDGTEIETINLSADTEREYSYTVASNSALLGVNAFVIKAVDNHAGIASIVVTRTYAISLAQLIEETEIGGTLTLTCDYATDNAVIDKAITINGGNHTIGDLKIENTGDLTLGSGLIVRDFTICAKAGNTTTPAASGQVRNATNLTCNRNAYFLYTVDPSGQVHYGWYDFTVPFPVNAASGIKGIQEGVLKENFAYGPDYAIMDYDGAKQAQGQYPYKKFSGVMQPNKLYSITLDNDYNYNTLRMQKTAEGPLVAGDNVTLNAYSGDGIHDNWNGVGNGTLHHADAGISGDYVQVYQSGSKTFLPVNKNDYSFVVGTAFMVQETGTMTLSQATPDNDLLAPARQASAPATAIQIAREGQPFSDQLFISASETGGQAYTPGTDLAKAGDLGSANVPQIWTNAYNNPLCVHEAQLINGEATYNLSIYAPAADTYTLTSRNIPADYSLYLTQNGTMLTELSGTYTLDLNKGITTEYGLLLVETYKTPTGMEEPMSQESRVKSQKILHNGVLYILHNGKVYNAQGGKVCDL